ncbi:MAG: restriction endonuclease subunit S, partial [Chitinophagales bacterium]|nr:restriction endonuclease subunit S [Chitinophagales bacterium]
QIVAECEAIDQKVSEARAEIEKARGEIEERISKIYNHNHASIKIKDLCQININTFGPTSKQDDIFIYIDIDSVGKGNGIIDYSKNILGKNLPSRARRKASKGCSIISTVRPYLKGFAFLQSEPPENCVFSTGFAVLKPFDTLLHDKLLFLLFMYSKELMNQMESAMPKSSYPSINKEDIENFQIPVPPLTEQTALVAEIEKLEAKIAEGQSIIQSAAAAKQAVMKKYL